LQRDRQQIGMDQERLRMEQERLRIAREEADRKRAASAATGGVDTTEAEKTAAFLATRVASGLSTLGTLGRSGDPTIGSQLANAVPFGLGNYATDEARQRTRDAQLDILDAALTLGTGAAYTREQLEGYRQSYFPQIGDGENNIKDKNERLKVLLAAARVKAGAAAPQIDAALAAAGLEGGKNTPASEAGAVIDPTGARETITPEDREYNALAQELYNRGGNRADFTALAQRYGRQDFGEDLDSALATRDRGGRASFVAEPSGRTGPTVMGALAASPVGSYFASAGDTVSMGTLDEAAGLLGGNTGDARLSQQLMQRENPNASLAGSITGGFALPTFGASGAAGLARLGAAYGGLYGAGSADDGIANRLLGAAKGASVGAAVGYAGGALGDRLARGGGGNPPAGGPSDLLAAANRQGIDPLPADVGGPLTRRLTGATAQSPYGGGSIIRGGQRVVDQAEAARNRIANSVGTPVDPVAAGEAATSGALSYRSTSGAAGTRLYDRAAAMAGDARIDPAQARQVLDQNIADLAQSPLGAPETLVNLRSKLDGNFTVAGLRNLRTQLRDEFAAKGLRGSDAERRGMQAVDALTDDIATGLEAQGKREAAEAYRSADQFWRERLETIDSSLKPIIGDGSLSGEKVMNNIMSATRSDSGRLSRFMESLPPEEQATVRATVINNLGKANPGAQNAEGQAFSLNTFLTHWNQMTPRAKGVLFKGEARAALDDLAKVAEGSREAGRYANHSNTGGSLMSLVNISTGAAQFLTGKLLSSRRFARALASPAGNPTQIANKLTNIASREPALAPDINGLVQALQQSPGRMAASTGEENQ